MIERLHLSAIILVAAVLWAALLILEGVAIEVSWFRPFSAVVGASLLLIAAFDLLLWRVPFLHPWFVKRPDLRGTWRAEIRSNWKAPATGQPIPPITAYMAIRQTFSKLSLRLITSESRSELLGAEILRADDGTYRVIGVYRNEPRLSVRDRSPIHYGGLVLQVVSERATKLEGHYWTDRDTAGEIYLTAKRRRLIDDFESAQRAFGQ